MKPQYLLLIVVLLASGCAGRNSSSVSNAPAGTASADTYRAGQIVKLDFNTDSCAVLTTLDAYDEFFKSAKANDRSGFAELIQARKMFFVERNTSAKILTDDIWHGRCEVRILGGEHADKKGWVAKDWIKPSP
jgi:hypothetical protein